MIGDQSFQRAALLAQIDPFFACIVLFASAFFAAGAIMTIMDKSSAASGLNKMGMTLTGLAGGLKIGTNRERNKSTKDNNKSTKMPKIKKRKK